MKKRTRKASRGSNKRRSSEEREGGARAAAVSGENELTMERRKGEGERGRETGEGVAEERETG